LASGISKGGVVGKPTIPRGTGEDYLDSDCWGAGIVANRHYHRQGQLFTDDARLAIAAHDGQRQPLAWRTRQRQITTTTPSQTRRQNAHERRHTPRAPQRCKLLHGITFRV
jgi:hypothetical protein